MQRRDARSFLQEVLAQIPDLSPNTREQLLEIVADKPGPKRAARLASVIALEHPLKTTEGETSDG